MDRQEKDGKKMERIPRLKKKTRTKIAAAQRRHAAATSAYVLCALQQSCEGNDATAGAIAGCPASAAVRIRHVNFC